MLIKPHLSVVTVGHVDAGGSTLIGRLLFDLGSLSNQEIARMREEASLPFHLGGNVFRFAAIATDAEKRRGIVTDVHMRHFFTNSYHYTIINAPKHLDFIRKTIQAIVHADVAILVVPANEGGFETAIAKGRSYQQGMTRLHARLCHLFGITQIIVVINKMDCNSVHYHEERYNEIKGEMTKMLTKIGYNTKKIPFIPISASEGDNVFQISTNMYWWKGYRVEVNHRLIEGFTLYSALETVIQIPPRKDDDPFMMPIESIYNIKGVGKVFTGRILQGTIYPGNNIQHVLSKSYFRHIKSIEMHRNSVDVAHAGDIVGMCIDIKPGTFEKLMIGFMSDVEPFLFNTLSMDIRGLIATFVGKLSAMHFTPNVGDVMVSKHSDMIGVVGVAVTFTAMVFVRDHPGKITCGYTPMVYAGTGKSPCKMTKIQWKISKTTKDKKVSQPEYLEAGDQAEVVFDPVKEIVLAEFQKCARLGRIAVVDCDLVMLGKIILVKHMFHCK
eukprot:151735_1